MCWCALRRKDRYFRFGLLWFGVTTVVLCLVIPLSFHSSVSHATLLTGPPCRPVPRAAWVQASMPHRDGVCMVTHALHHHSALCWSCGAFECQQINISCSAAAQSVCNFSKGCNEMA